MFSAWATLTAPSTPAGARLHQALRATSTGATRSPPGRVRGAILTGAGRCSSPVGTHLDARRAPRVDAVVARRWALAVSLTFRRRARCPVPRSPAEVFELALNLELARSTYTHYPFNGWAAWRKHYGRPRTVYLLEGPTTRTLLTPESPLAVVARARELKACRRFTSPPIPNGRSPWRCSTGPASPVYAQRPARGRSGAPARVRPRPQGWCV
jgi:hypothetical protein